MSSKFWEIFTESLTVIIVTTSHFNKKHFQLLLKNEQTKIL
jgi:hypothetical protein